MTDNNPWYDWVKDGSDAKPTFVPPTRPAGVPLRKRHSRPAEEPEAPRVNGATVREYLDRMSGWRPKDLADELNRSRPFISKLLAGSRNPHGEELAEIAYALSVKPKWLWLETPISWEEQDAWLERLRDDVRQELIDSAERTPADERTGVKRAPAAEMLEIGKRIGVHWNTVRRWWNEEERPPTKHEPRPPIPFPSMEKLRETLTLDPNSPSGLVLSEGHKYAGDIAGNPSEFVVGGWLVKVGIHRYPAHRLAWALDHGRAPRGPVGFVDGDTSNHATSNLVEMEA